MAVHKVAIFPNYFRFSDKVSEIILQHLGSRFMGHCHGNAQVFTSSAQLLCAVQNDSFHKFYLDD